MTPDLDALALAAVTTPSLDAPAALEVLVDALEEAGIICRRKTKPWIRRTQVFHWAMRRIYPGLVEKAPSCRLRTACRFYQASGVTITIGGVVLSDRGTDSISYVAKGSYKL